MSSVPDYEDVVALYIRMIKEDSPSAAAAIEQIREVCNVQAALRATLAMTLLKMDVQQHRPLSDASAYAYLLVDYPEALPLLDLAIQSWTRDRRIRGLSLGLESDVKGDDTGVSAPITDFPPDLKE